MFLLLAAVVWPYVADLMRVLLCRSLVNACKNLGQLYINMDQATSQAVVKGLKARQLRIILYFPGRWRHPLTASQEPGSAALTDAARRLRHRPQVRLRLLRYV